MIFLILGSSGLIGKNLSNYLKSQGHSVIDFDILIDPSHDLRLSLNQKLIESIKIADFVFFLAFDVGGANYLERKNKDYKFISNNLKILVNTFEIIKKFEKRFVFVSTYQIYKPEHSYAITKLIGEHLSNSLNGLVVRLYNVYGVEIAGSKSHVIPDMVKQAVHRGKINLRTNGKESRQFLHVEDCCKGLYSVVINFDSIIKEKKVIEITSFKWHSIISIANIISEKLNCDVVVSNRNACFVFEPEPDNTILKYWNPEIEIETGIIKLLNQYK